MQDQDFIQQAPIPPGPMSPEGPHRSPGSWFRLAVMTLAALIVVMVAVFSVLSRPKPVSDFTVVPDTKLYNPDHTVDVNLASEAIVDGPTEFTVKKNAVLKLQFHVSGDEEQIHLVGPGVDINTESDGTSTLPGSIVFSSPTTGEFDLVAYADTPDNLEPSPDDKHILGKVKVTE